MGATNRSESILEFLNGDEASGLVVRAAPTEMGTAEKRTEITSKTGWKDTSWGISYGTPALVSAALAVPIGAVGIS